MMFRPRLSAEWKGRTTFAFALDGMDGKEDSCLDARTKTAE